MTAPRPRGEREETAWERRRRLDRVFGDALPETTRDERDEPSERNERGERGDAAGARGSSADGKGEDPGDAWLREQGPPHHG